MHCTKVDEGAQGIPGNAIVLSNYWVNNTDVSCYVGHHLVLFLVLTLPVVMIVYLRMPLTLLFMSASIEDESDPSVEAHGFLCQPYREGYLHREAVIVRRKAILAALAVFSRILGENLQGILSLAILVVCVVVHHMAGPFVMDGPNLNRTEPAFLMCSAFAFFVGLLFNDPNVTQSGRSAIYEMFTVIMTTVLCYLASQLVVEIIKEVDRGMRVRRRRESKKGTFLMKL